MTEDANNEQVLKYQKRFGDRKNVQKPDLSAEQDAARVAAEELYAKAVISVIDRQDASVDALKKELGVGSNKVRDLLSKMEKNGVVSAPSEDFLQMRTVLVEKDESMVDAVNEDKIVEEDKAEEINKPVGSEIGDDAFWESPASEGLDKASYLLDKDLYAKVKNAYSDYKKSNEDNQAQGDEGEVKEAEEKPETLVVEELEADAPLVANEGEDNGWVEKYDAFLRENAEENGKVWNRTESPEGTLKGSMGEDLDLSFAAESRVSFAMKKDKVPTADSFKELVALSKKEDMDLDISGITKPESRKAIIEAAAKGGVEIDGLSNEEQDFYKSFLAIDEKTEEKTEEKTFSRMEELKEKHSSNAKIASLTLKKFDRLCENHPNEFDETIARLEASGAKLGGADKESEKYTLATYAKTSRSLEASPEDAKLKEMLGNLEIVLGRYGLAMDNKSVEGKADFGVKEAEEGSLDARKFVEAKNSLSEVGEYSQMKEKNKYKSSPDAEHIMARRGEFERSN